MLLYCIIVYYYYCCIVVIYILFGDFYSYPVTPLLINNLDISSIPAPILGDNTENWKPATKCNGKLTSGTIFPKCVASAERNYFAALGSIVCFTFSLFYYLWHLIRVRKLCLYILLLLYIIVCYVIVLYYCILLLCIIIVVLLLFIYCSEIFTLILLCWLPLHWLACNRPIPLQSK